MRRSWPTPIGGKPCRKKFAPRSPPRSRSCAPRKKRWRMAESLLAVAMRPVAAEKAVERDPSVMGTPRAEQEDYSDHLARLVRYFEEAENVGREARERSERCRDYYNNNQLTQEEIAVLKRRGQP